MSAWRACVKAIPQKKKKDAATLLSSPPCLHKQYCMTYTVKILEMLFLRQQKVIQFI